MQYRPHVDGLRTVAIVPVVLFHADVALFTGGFTGVDVFFVISGFLITSLIVEEIAEDRFTIWNFYKRRALRILPAYLAVLAAVLAASWFILFPDEARALGRSVAAASLFVSNIYFWQVSDYFDPAVETAPLLHTWTLAVEEQYYLLLPVLLMVVARFLGRRYAMVILAGSALSFALCLWAIATWREAAAFYLLPTRAWEFGLGSLAAVTALPSRGGARMRAAGAVTGAALVAWSVFGLDEEASFPGLNAVFPALGAMLLIACAEGNLVGRVLGSRPFVALGRISYSLYLWHWPIIVFWKMQMGSRLGPVDVVAVVALSLVAATLSFRYVEEPFRRPAMRRRPALRINGAALASLALAGGLGFGLVGGAERWGSYPRELARIADYADYRADLEVHPCLIHAGVPGQAQAFEPRTCLAADATRPTLLVLGDSHAEHLMAAIEDAFPTLNVQAAGATGCPPTLDVEGDWYCPEVIGRVLREHVPRGGVDAVMLSARWSADDIDSLQQTVDYLLRHVEEVVILGPTPEYLGSFPLLLARTLRYGDDDVGRFLDPEIRALDRRMAAEDWGSARYVSLYNLICPEDCRRFTEEGVPYFADYGHYTRAAAREIAEDLAQMRVITVHRTVEGG